MHEGDIIKLDYDAWVTDSEELMETTDEDLAREEGTYDGGRVYGPIAVVLGDDALPEGLREAIEKAEVGQEEEIEVPPEKGYGERDPEKVEIFSRREFRKRDLDPEPGMEVEIRNKRGRVMSVTPGRVRVDFNEPLAGKTLRYRFTVTEKLDDPAAKVEAIIATGYNRSHAEDFEIHVDEETARIEIPDIAKFDPQWFQAKANLVDRIRQYSGVREVVFIEEHVQPEPAGEEPEEAEEPEAEDEEEPVVTESPDEGEDSETLEPGVGEEE